jgi:hypothetical protein
MVTEHTRINIDEDKPFVPYGPVPVDENGNPFPDCLDHPLFVGTGDFANSLHGINPSDILSPEVYEIYKDVLIGENS